jgi:hypothetical protein
MLKRKKTFKEDPATVQQYKHKGKCMQKGEENIPGGRRRSCNAVEGCWRDYQCCRLFQLFLPYSLFVSWVLTSAIFVPLSLLVICTFWRQTKELQCCWRQLARLSVLSSVPALSPLFSVRLLSFNFCNLRPSLSTSYLHFLEADEGAATLLKAAGKTISVVVCSNSFSPILYSSPEF